MNKLVGILIAALVVSAMLITGCAKKATTTTSQPPATTTSQPPPTTTSQPPPTTTTSPLTTMTTMPPPTTSTTPPQTTTTPPPTTGVTTNQVIVMGYQFTPATITVKAGTRVFWMNQDMVDHTVTSDTPGIFDNQLIAGGTTSITFSVPGTYNYHCTPHPFMTGTVIVI